MQLDILGPEHENVATTYHQLGNLSFIQENQDKAEEYLEKSFKNQV